MDIFQVVSDPVRRGLLEALSGGPRSVTSLADQFPISQPAISRHLKVLRQAKLVEIKSTADDGRLRMYRLHPEPLREIQGWLEHFWQEQLESLAGYVRERS